MSRTSAETYIEVRIALSGRNAAAESDTGTPAGWDDIAIDGIEHVRTTAFRSLEGSRPRTVIVDLLVGLDAKARNIVLSNLQDAPAPGDTLSDALSDAL